MSISLSDKIDSRLEEEEKKTTSEKIEAALARPEPQQPKIRPPFKIDFNEMAPVQVPDLDVLPATSSPPPRPRPLDIEPVSEAIKSGWMNTTQGMLYQLSTGEIAPPPEDFERWQRWMAMVSSFMLDPLTYASYGLSGAMAQKAVGALVKKGASRGAQALAKRSLTTGGLLAGITAVQQPMQQALAGQEYSPAEHALETGKSLAVGLAAGGAGVIPKVGLAAEMAAFPVAHAAVEGRLPTLDDFIDATAVILSMKAVSAAIKPATSLLKLTKGEKLTPEETEAIAEILPAERLKIAERAKENAIVRVGKPSRADVKGTPGEVFKTQAERTRYAQLLKEKHDATQIRVDEGQVLPRVPEKGDVPQEGAGKGEGKSIEDIQRHKEAGRAEPAPLAEPPIRSPAEAVGFVSLDDTFKAMKTGLSGLNAFRKRFLRSRGNLPKPIWDAKLARDGWINSQMSQIRYTRQDFNKAKREAYGFGQIDEGELAKINAVLHGQQHAGILPEPMRGAVHKMRNQIDSLSRHLIDEGITEGDLQVTIENNLGMYVTRSYQVFDDPKWYKKVPEDVRNKGKAWLRAEYEGLSEAEIEGRIKSLLYEGKAAESPLGLIASGKLGRKDLSILKRRKNVPPELRALLGEYTDPMVNYVRSATKIAHLIANQRFLNRVREAEGGKFFREGQISDATGDYITRLAFPQEHAMSPLNGLYTTPEIKAAFERAYDPRNLPWWLRHYMKANMVVKYGKTILFPQTHERNFLANPMFAIAAGHWEVGVGGVVTGGTLGAAAGGAIMGAPGALGMGLLGAFAGGRAQKGLGPTLASLGLSRRSEWRREFRRLQELNVVNESARAGELYDAIGDAIGKGWDKYVDQTSEKLAKRALRAITELYRAEDDVYKVAAQYSEEAMYSRARPDLSRAEIEQMSAEHVRNIYPTYSLVSELIQKLRRFPILGSFVSFGAEVYRTSYNLLELTGRELMDPRTRAIGAKRLAGMAIVAAGPATVTATSRFLAGVTKKDDEDLRNFVAPWAKDSQMVHVGKNEKDIYDVIDLSYTDPYQYLRRPVIAFMRGEDWKTSFFEAVRESLEPFLSEEILFESLVDVIRNQRADGGTVYNPQDPPGKQARDRRAHIWKSFEPGAVSSGRRIAKGLMGKTSKYGKAFDPKMELLAAGTGHRISPIDVLQSLSWKARGFQRDTSAASAMLGGVAGRRGAVKDAEIFEAYESMENARQRLFAEMAETVSAAQRLGFPEDKVRQVLRASGISKEKTEDLIGGTYNPYVPSSQFLGAITKVSRALPQEGAAGPPEFYRRRRLVEQLASEQPGADPEWRADQLSSLVYGFTNTKKDADNDLVAEELRGLPREEVVRALTRYWIKRGWRPGTAAYNKRLARLAQRLGP